MLRSRLFKPIKQLIAAAGNTEVLKTGSKGDGVGAVQYVLARTGARMAHTFVRGHADGVFGVETDAAVRKFQAKNSLKIDGIVGQHTMKALDDLLIAYPLLDTFDEKADKAQDFKDLSRPLIELRRAHW